MKPTIDSSKFHACPIRQSLLRVFPVKFLLYTLYTSLYIAIISGHV